MNYHVFAIVMKDPRVCHGPAVFISRLPIAPSAHLHQISYKPDPHHDAVGLLPAYRMSATPGSVCTDSCMPHLVAVRDVGNRRGC